MGERVCVRMIPLCDRCLEKLIGNKPRNRPTSQRPCPIAPLTRIEQSLERQKVPPIDDSKPSNSKNHSFDAPSPSSKKAHTTPPRQSVPLRPHGTFNPYKNNARQSVSPSLSPRVHRMKGEVNVKPNPRKNTLPHSAVASSSSNSWEGRGELTHLTQ